MGYISNLFTEKYCDRFDFVELPNTISGCPFPNMAFGLGDGCGAGGQLEAVRGLLLIKSDFNKE